MTVKQAQKTIYLFIWLYGFRWDRVGRLWGLGNCPPHALALGCHRGVAEAV